MYKKIKLKIYCQNTNLDLVSNKDFLTYQRYKRTLMTHLMIYFNLGVIPLKIYWWRHQIRHKTHQNVKKRKKKSLFHGCVHSTSCWGYTLEANSWCFGILLIKESTVAMRVGAHSFPYCQGVKKKNLLSECSFLVF